MLIKKDGLGLKDPVTSPIEKYLSLIGERSKIIGYVTE